MTGLNRREWARILWDQHVQSIAGPGTLLGLLRTKAVSAGKGPPPGGMRMPSYQTGGVVKKTGPALLHKGEVVVPAGPQPSSEWDDVGLTPLLGGLVPRHFLKFKEEELGNRGEYDPWRGTIYTRPGLDKEDVVPVKAHEAAHALTPPFELYFSTPPKELRYPASSIPSAYEYGGGDALKRYYATGVHMRDFGSEQRAMIVMQYFRHLMRPQDDPIRKEFLPVYAHYVQQLKQMYIDAIEAAEAKRY